MYSKLESIFKQIILYNPAAKFSINVNDNSNAHTEWYCGSDDSAETACPQEHTTALWNLYVLPFLLYKDKPETKNFGKLDTQTKTTSANLLSNSKTS